jgi:hypothetical protein
MIYGKSRMGGGQVALPSFFIPYIGLTYRLFYLLIF